MKQNEKPKLDPSMCENVMADKSSIEKPMGDIVTNSV